MSIHNGKSRPMRNRPSQRRNNGLSSNGRRMASNGKRSNGGVNPANALNARNKYIEKAKEALGMGDKVLAENYFQHADHYSRILMSSENRRSYEDNIKSPENEANDASTGGEAENTRSGSREGEGNMAGEPAV